MREFPDPGSDPSGSDEPDLSAVAFRSALDRPTGPSRPHPRSRWRRRLRGVALLLAGLIAAGGVHAGFALASAPAAADVDEDVRGDEAAGQSLFSGQCITCHGVNLQGVDGRGPSLVGVGEAAVYFQVSTGRMPLAQQDAQADRKPPQYTEQQVEDLGAYVSSFGGGPAVPTGNLRAADRAAGGDLFRYNCAQCHGFSGHGGALSAGKYAPTLEPASDRQIYAAMLSGPENMPVFSDGQLTPQQKREIIAYVQNLKQQRDPGGQGIGRIGPVSEGVVIWVVGVGALMIVILWIGAKS